MKLTMQASQGGLTPSTPYELTIQAENTHGAVVLIGVGGSTSDAAGKVVFPLAPMILQAVGRAMLPCAVTIWVRAAGSPVHAPPVKPGATTTFPVV